MSANRKIIYSSDRTRSDPLNAMKYRHRRRTWLNPCVHIQGDFASSCTEFLLLSAAPQHCSEERDGHQMRMRIDPWQPSWAEIKNKKYESKKINVLPYEFPKKDAGSMELRF